MSGMLRLTVLGAGYLGITHAACMASLGFEVLGVDTDQGKADELNAGTCLSTNRAWRSSYRPGSMPGG